MFSLIKIYCSSVTKGEGVSNGNFCVTYLLWALDEKIYLSDDLGLPRLCDQFIDELKNDRDLRKTQDGSDIDTSNVACFPQEHLAIQCD